MIDRIIEKLDEEIFRAIIDATEDITADYEMIAKKFDVPVEVVEELSWFWVTD